MNGQLFDSEDIVIQVIHFLERNVGAGIFLLLLLVTILSLRRTYVFKKGAVRIEGVFSGNEEIISRDGDRMYKGLYEYIDPDDGSKRILRTSISISSPKGFSGEKRWVLYNKKGPIVAQFDSALELWILPVIAGIFALVTLVSIF